MKILHVCLASFYIDNFSYQENLLPKFHKRQGHDVEIVASLVTFDSDGRLALLPRRSKYANEHGIGVTRLRYRRLPFSRLLRFYDGLDKELSRSDPDIIFVHGVQFADLWIIRRYMRENPGKCLYIDNHADFSNSARSRLSRKILHGIVWRTLAGLIEPYTTRFYGVLPARVDFLTDVYGLPSDRVGLLVMGADDEEVTAALDSVVQGETRRALGIEDDEFLLVTGGKIDPEKAQVLSLMKFVRDSSDPKLKLVVFGSVVPELKEDVLTLSESDRITFVGWAGTSDSYRLFAAADLVVFPGRHSVYWEQVCGMGKPMVVKRWQGTDHVDIGGNCLFLESDDSQELTKSLRSIIYNQDVYQRLVDAAHGKGRETFSYSAIAARSISEAGGME